MTTLLTGGATRGREALDDDVDLARDRALVTRAQSGDRAAFDDLYMRYYRRLYRFCLRRLHDTHEAEDVAQEAFARSWRALPTFGGDRRFYPWLSVIASHLCTDVLRRRNRSTPVAEFHQSNVASTEDGGEELMVAAVDSEMVARAFTRLSDRHQRILNLREGSGWSYQRIADHEGVGITAVETLLWRARQALKREFATLAGAEGRMGAWLGGALSLAGLRRLFRLPARTMHRISSTGAQGAAVAAGSAVAATAMVLGAALSVPAPSHGIGSALPGALGAAGSGLVGANLPSSGGSSGAGGAVAGGPGSSGGSAGLSVPGGVPSVPSGSGLPANPLRASIQQAGGTLQNV
ncbi:MAG: RNA polymerase sigma factor, partial [Acidobacteriota bacterium]|nr:RNA polymerase sigma factor [Acidobacteriota bacterium]